MASIKVKHNVEMAHRLFETKGKCEAIHGHSWWINLQIFGKVDGQGILEGLDFGFVKKLCRNYLDENFDHRVLLNLSDPWAQDLDPGQEYDGSLEPKLLPGLQTMNGDPTTENFAANIGLWAIGTFRLPVDVEVWETAVNCATWRSFDAPTT